jgi:hypothetical protein
MVASPYGTKHDLARHVLFKGCNAGLDRPGDSLRASREAVVRDVAPLGKDAPLPARRALRPTASQLAEPVNATLAEYRYYDQVRRFLQ